ncbi:MAG: chromate transporter [Spirochaetales bacterium]|jgi:chromate transporter|nr:chromate transporter [Spirochaetales bacterium]
MGHFHRSPLIKALDLYWIFFRIGAFTIGGGYAMLPIIEKEFVSKKKWISEEEMVDIIAIVQSLPGVIAFNTSMFIGFRSAGLLGAVLAALGMLTPSLLIISCFAYLYVSVNTNSFVQAAFHGIRSGVTALIGIAGFKLAKRVVSSFLAAFLAAASFTAVWILEVHAALVFVAAAVIGLSIAALRKIRKHDPA